jgi:hypothetical protein
MNCDYCGSEVKTSEVTMTDMGDQVCKPCLVGKPIEVVKPTVGMSVSMGIGSDSYHEIIVKMERNAKTIYTMSARSVIGGVALSDWNEMPESIKAKRAADAMQDQLELFRQEFPTMSEEWAMRQQVKCYTYRNTGRRAGKYVAKGSTCCTLILDDQYEYLDPSF